MLRIRPSGIVEKFVSVGSGGLLFPLGLTFGKDGNLYVANNVGNVLRYDRKTGAFLGVFATGLTVPQCLAFGPDGDLYVGNADTDSISRFDGVTGASLGFFVSPGSFGLSRPTGIAFGPSRDLYVKFPTNTIFRFEHGTGALVGTFDPPYQDGIDALLDVAFGPDLKLYAAVRPGSGGMDIVRLDPNTGAVLSLFVRTPPPLSFNTGMLFVDPGCALIRSVSGGASRCFVPTKAEEVRP